MQLIYFHFLYFNSIARWNFKQCKLQIDHEYAIAKRLSSLSGFNRTLDTTITCVECVCVLCLLTNDDQINSGQCS